MPDPIDPSLAIALAAAAGLDPTDLRNQIRRQQAGDDDPDKLRARIAELEAQVAHPLDSATPLDPGAEPEDASAVRSATPQQAHELLAKQLHDAQSEWITLRGPGGSDDGQAA